MTAAAPFVLRSVVVERGAHSAEQGQLAARLGSQLAALEGGAEAAKLAAFVHDHAGIAQRHFEVPFEGVERRTDWYRLVNEASESLGRRTLERLFEADPGARGNDALVVVSSTHAGFPSLSRRLQQALLLPVEATCFDLAGLGCAGATQGWSFAHALLASGQARRVSLLLVDTMGTFSQSRRQTRPPSMEQLVAHCLASDGAAALSLARESGDRFALRYCDARLASRCWRDALHLNDLTADHDNAPFLSVGADIRKRLIDELAPYLGADPAAEPIYFHPGGAALMSALVRHDPRLVESAALSLSILRENGNVGAPSAVWVLDRALDRGMPVGPTLRLVALGPGIVTTTLELDGVERGQA
jgi:alkylresorcinol/alkylpyrone synthase